MREQLTEPDLSVIFLSYNRSDLLAIALKSLRARASFDGIVTEYIVSDDASEPPHLTAIHELPFDAFVLARANHGLGNNGNKGITAARGTFILQIQDDCEFIGPPDAIMCALRVLRADPSVGVVQFTHMPSTIPHEMRALADGTRYAVFANDGIPRVRHCSDRPYTDQPHLKRKLFCEDLGPYREGVPMTDMELEFQLRVACQQRWHVAHLPIVAFQHIGSTRSFNPSNLRAERIAAREAIPVIGPALRLIRVVGKRIAVALGLR